MGEITRAFPFVSERTGETFSLQIREPPLTGDSLGLKTWGSSYVLAKLLPELAEEYLSHIHVSSENVLELGSGTGLLGLAAACLWGAHVTLTDLPSIMPNLVFNVESNRPSVAALGGSVDTGPLTWGNAHDTDERFHADHQYEVSGLAMHCTCTSGVTLTCCRSSLLLILFTTMITLAYWPGPSTNS
jgi:hypothetical protein